MQNFLEYMRNSGTRRGKKKVSISQTKIPTLERVAILKQLLASWLHRETVAIPLAKAARMVLKTFQKKIIAAIGKTFTNAGRGLCQGDGLGLRWYLIVLYLLKGVEWENSRFSCSKLLATYDFAGFRKTSRRNLSLLLQIDSEWTHRNLSLFESRTWWQI